MTSSFRVLARCSLLLVFATALSGAQQLPPPPSQHQVAILRQINHVNDDGSYTYGYEAADGSFKIETRDVLGTVKGMFGFVDESGRQRRVSYTAGNTTGFQTTRQPGAEGGGPGDAGVTATPARIYHPTAPPQLILRPVRPFLTGSSAGRDSVAKLIQHLGIIRTKQAESGRVDTIEETPRTTSTAKTTTASSEAAQQDSGKGDEVTTRRPTVVQRILRTRPRTNSNSRKEEGLPVNLRAPPVSPLGQTESSTKKGEEEEKRDEGRSTTADSRQRQPLVALKVSENGGVPRFVILPSRALRWRQSSEDDPRKAQEERFGFHPESPLRPRLLEFQGQRDNNLQFQLRQLTREQLAESQPPLQIFAQKSLPNTNYQDQQILPQKNVYSFVTTTPRPRLVQPQPTNPISTHASLRVPPENIQMYQQVYEPTPTPHEATRLLFQEGNYADKIQQPQTFLQQPQMVYQQKPVVYNADPRRYDPYYPRPNAYSPNLQVYPYYGRQDLLELLLSYLQLQSRSPQPQNGFTNPLSYNSNINALQHQEYPQVGARYQSPAIVIPYPPQYDQYQDAYRPAPVDNNNFDLRRFLGLRTLFRPSIRPQIELQNPLPGAILYGNGYDVSYLKNKGNGYQENYYGESQGGRINSQQEVAHRPIQLQFQPLFLEATSRSTVTPQQQGFSVLPTGQDNLQPKFTALGATSVAQTTTEAPTPPENQGLPYGFTKKFRSVQIIPPEAYNTSEKASKSDS